MTTFYRKYRPRKIAELDLGSVRDQLMGMLSAGKLAQAYLMVGPRGSGKTSSARVLAKAVNCSQAKGGAEPCLECDVCMAAENGSLVDIIEIDAASHRGIDAIRELRDKIGLAPVMGTKKVYIIDEVHMLTNEAFNALLKTLEEPPEHVMFFLCTTEEHKVPETVASRCVKVKFSKAGAGEVMDSLRKVVEGEGIKAQDEALKLLAESVDGSFREGHKLLEQLAGQGEVTVETVKRVLGRSQSLSVEEFGEMLMEGKTQLALEAISKGEEEGVDWPTFGIRLVDWFRGEVRASYGMAGKKSKYPTGQVVKILNKVAEAVNEMGRAAVPVLPLELVVVRLGRGEIEEISDVEDDKKEEVFGAGKRVAGASDERPIQQDKKAEKKIKTDRKIEPGELGVPSVSFDEVMSKWESLINTLAPQNHSVAGLLRSCKPKAVEDRYLVVEAYYKFHKEQLEQDTRRRIFEEVLREEVGLPAVRFVLGERAQKAVVTMAEHDNVSVPDEDKELVKAVEDVFGQ